MGACASQREVITISDDEYLCQEIETQLKLKQIQFKDFRAKLLHLGPKSDLSQSQLEDLLASLSIDLELEYRNPAKPLLAFMDYFFDHNTQEYRQDLLLATALLLAEEEFENKRDYLWWILEKQPGVVYYPQVENLAITFLEVAVILIPSLARRFDNGMGETARELETLRPVRDVAQYAKKLLTDLRIDENGVNDKITERKFSRFMDTNNGQTLLSTTLLRRFVIKLLTPGIRN